MTLEELAQQYPGWRMWTSRNGGLVCATRNDDLSDAVIAERRLSRTLVEDDVRALKAQLQEETDRAAGL